MSKKNMPKTVGVIGATGSVGSAMLDICGLFPCEFNVEALACSCNIEKMQELCRQFSPSAVYMALPPGGWREKLPSGMRFYHGKSGLAEMVRNEHLDHWAFASSGTDAIEALQEALVQGAEVSVANKESIVVAGPWVMPLVCSPHQMRPVDSEHSAVWQCLRDEPQRAVSGITLTASGGPFLNTPPERLEHMEAADALKHPVWSMGAKITVDSATMVNKGIECIEAMRLFGLPMEKVGAVIHPGSHVHGMVTFTDGVCRMLASRAHMRLPAACALSYPDRLVLDEPFNLPERLEFYPIDMARYPGFYTACEAGRRGGAYPALLVGADEAAVEAFLSGRIQFTRIAGVLSDVLSAWSGPVPSSLEEAVALVGTGRRMTLEMLKI